MEKLFRLREHNTTVRTEITAGITTFFTMAYIIFVNPAILSLAGMDSGGVFTATCLAAALGTFIMAFFANLPFAQAPGMGLNAFFAYTICITMGFHWREALAIVFICGVLGMLLTATPLRRSLITAIPDSLQNAIGGSIGLFIAYIGIKNAGIIGFADTVQGYTIGAQAVPQLASFGDAGMLLSLVGIAITALLMLLNVRGALIIGIIAATLIGIPMGVTNVSGLAPFGTDAGLREVSFAFFQNPGLGTLFSDPSRIFTAAAACLALLLTNTFDSIGGLVSMGRQSGMLSDSEMTALRSGKGFRSRFERGLFGNFAAATVGSLLGTSNVLTYIESASGVNAGGRTGLTALVTGILLLLCIPFAPLVGIIPAEATAPALILVGLLMMSSFKNIEWGDFGEALPAFFTVIIMVFGYSIADGIAAGFIFFCLVKLCKGEYRKIHPILAVSAALFVVNFALMAVLR